MNEAAREKTLAALPCYERRLASVAPMLHRLAASTWLGYRLSSRFIMRILLRCLVGASVFGALPATGQMPATPVLQNAWANSGITLAANYGRVTGASAFAGALAWAPTNARFQLSIGGGAVHVDSGAGSGGYGARLSVPLVEFASGSIGTSVFGGVGFFGRKAVRESNFPVGLSLGWRHALGTTRAISAYVAPFYLLSRRKGTVNGALKDDKGSVIRASVGLDVTLAPRIGMTVGYESGARAKELAPGPRGSAFGVALSYALHRQP